MLKRRLFALFLASACASGPTFAEVDEGDLCKHFGYPVGTTKTFFADCYRVGAWSNLDKLFAHNTAQPASIPFALKVGAPLGEIRYKNPKGEGELTLEDYLARFRVTTFIVLKDDAIVFERYQYERQPAQLMLSMSVSKTILGVLVGLALEDGHFKSLGERVVDVLPDFTDSAFADDTLEDLLRMSSGAKTTMHTGAGTAFDHPGADNIVINPLVSPRADVRAFLRGRTERVASHGTDFNYSSTVTALIGLMLRERVGTPLTAYLEKRLWQPMGAQSRAIWIKNKMGVEGVQGHFAATAHDYARFGYLLMNGGLVNGRQVVPSEWVKQMTTVRRDKPQPVPSPYYGLQTWIPVAGGGRGMAWGQDGQFIMFDPLARTVIVQTAVGKGGWREGLPHLVQLRDAIARKLATRAEK